MLKHKYLIKFKKAANKEFKALLQKGTFKYIKKLKINSNA
jgi:hypothetical protein